jgi:exonuclease VII small subunit
MNSSKYPEIFTQLQDAIAKLDTESASLTDAVQEYARGIQLKSACVEHLERLENSAEGMMEPRNLNASVSLEDVFTQLEELEAQAQQLPDNHLEDLLEIVESVESLIQCGEQHLELLQRSFNTSGESDV